MRTIAFGRRRLIRWGRDIFVFFILLSLIEVWQARDLLRGSLPLDLKDLPSLNAKFEKTYPNETYHLVYVFAPWCSVCKLSAPNLNRLSGQSFAVHALALSWGEQSELETFVQNTGLKVPVLLGGSREEELLQISAYPTHYLINPRGEVIRAWLGYTTSVGFFWKVYTARLWDQAADRLSTFLRPSLAK